MDVSTILSIIGLGITTSTASYAFTLQSLEGTKACEDRVIQTLYVDERLYMKMNGKVYTMVRVPTAKGVKNVRRFETRDRSVAFLQLPEKALVLDNVQMRPITNECRDI